MTLSGKGLNQALKKGAETYVAVVRSVQPEEATDEKPDD